MNYFIIMNNIAIPKEDEIYSIQKCQSKNVSSYLTQAKNSHGQDSYSRCWIFDESIPTTISLFCSILIQSYPFTHHL